MSRVSRLSPEVGERAVRLVRDTTKDHASERAAIQFLAGTLGRAAETMRRWERGDEQEAGECLRLATEDRERLKVLGMENRELRPANKILHKASA